MGVGSMRVLAALALITLLTLAPTAHAQDAGPGLAGGIVIPLNRAPDSPVVGAASLVPVTYDFTDVSVRVEGLNPGEVRVALLRSGSCVSPTDVRTNPANPNQPPRFINPPTAPPQPPPSLAQQPEPKYPIQLVTLVANDEGIAESKTTIPVSIYSVTFSPHFVYVGDRTPDEFNRGIPLKTLSCGDITERERLFPGPIQIVTPQIYRPLPNPAPMLPIKLPNTGMPAESKQDDSSRLPVPLAGLVLIGLGVACLRKSARRS